MHNFLRKNNLYFPRKKPGYRESRWRRFDGNTSTFYHHVIFFLAVWTFNSLWQFHTLLPHRRACGQYSQPRYETLLARTISFCVHIIWLSVYMISMNRNGVILGYFMMFNALKTSRAMVSCRGTNEIRRISNASFFKQYSTIANCL